MDCVAVKLDQLGWEAVWDEQQWRGARIWLSKWPARGPKYLHRVQFGAVDLALQVHGSLAASFRQTSSGQTSGQLNHATIALRRGAPVCTKQSGTAANCLPWLFVHVPGKLHSVQSVSRRADTSPKQKTPRRAASRVHLESGASSTARLAAHNGWTFEELPLTTGHWLPATGHSNAR